MSDHRDSEPKDVLSFGPFSLFAAERLLKKGDEPIPLGGRALDILRVIGAAMAEAGVVGLGRLTLSRRERMVVVEPRGTGMALFTLRAAEEVRAAQWHGRRRARR